jgi:hypothetical protein
VARGLSESEVLGRERPVRARELGDGSRVPRPKLTPPDEYPYEQSAAYGRLVRGIEDGRGAGEILSELTNSASDFTRKRVRQREQMERKLGQPWGPAFALLELLLVLAQDCGAGWRERVPPPEDPEGDPRIAAVTGLDARGMETASEVLRLLRAGLPRAALARWRTLYEQATTAAYLATAEEVFSRRYIESQWIEYEAYVRRHVEFLGDDADEADLRALSEAERMRDQALAAFPDLRGKRAWQADRERGLKDKSFAELQRRLGLGGYAEVQYVRANLQAHSPHLTTTWQLGASHGLGDGHVVAPQFLGLEQAGMATAPQVVLLSYSLFALWRDERCDSEADVLCGLAESVMRVFELTAAELARRDELVSRASAGQDVELDWHTGKPKPQSKRRNRRRHR